MYSDHQEHILVLRVVIPLFEVHNICHARFLSGQFWKAQTTTLCHCIWPFLFWQKICISASGLNSESHLNWKCRILPKDPSRFAIYFWKWQKTLKLWGLQNQEKGEFVKSATWWVESGWRWIDEVFNTRRNSTIISVPFCMWWNRNFLQGVTYSIKCNMVGNLSLLITQLLTRHWQFCWPYSVFSSRKSDSHIHIFLFSFLSHFSILTLFWIKILIYILREE